MGRPIFDEARIHPAIRDKIAAWGVDIVKEVQLAIESKAIVVVGMKMNPAPKRARKLLDAAGLDYTYLEYGSYLGGYRRRLPLKLWTGWQTFPMIFVRGVLIGGASDLKALMANGRLQEMLKKDSE
jgi:monothiol glutaredoxin